MKIKVLHVIYKTDIGGTEKAVLNYISNQNDSNIINDTCSLYSGKLSNEYKKQSNKYIAINQSNILKTYIKLKSYIRKNDYDIIYTYGFRTNILLRFMPKNFKLIYGIRGFENTSNKYINILNRLTIKRNNLIITNSKLNEKYILKKYNLKENQILSIYNGTFLPKERKKEINKKTLELIIIANLRKVKGFRYLLPAIKELINNNVYLNLTILGEGPERNWIETYIHENDLSENIQLYGQVEDVYKYLNNSHILISASLSEGLSNSIMEGMASGLPIIATNVGGSSELVVHNKSGVLIESENIKDIVKAIKKYDENPDLIELNGLYGREIIENKFSFENLINNNNNVFRMLKNTLKI